MKRINNVLVYPCETSLGRELHDSICHSPDFRLFGSPGDPVRGGYVYRLAIGPLPPLHADEFLPSLTQTVREYHIDFIYPASDQALLELSELASDGLVEAEVMAPGPDVCRKCLSRAAMHAFFSGKIDLPRQYRPGQIAAGDFPLWLDSGGMHRGGRRVDGTEDLAHAAEDTLLLEYLPGGEYAVDCFTDGSRGLLFVSGRERRAVGRHDSFNSILCDSPVFRRFADAINVEMAMRGAWSFLLKEDAMGRLRLVNIRPRPSASSGLQRARGMNLALEALHDRLGREVRPVLNELPGASADRQLTGLYRLHLHYDTVYMNLENTVTANGRVNLDTIRFIYQCRNRGVRVVLVERGPEPPERMLAQYRLDGLFDQVLWLEGTEGKSTVMTGQRAICIDAVEAERREVAKNLGLPVFAPSAIDALMEP